MKSLTVPARIDQLDEVHAFVSGVLGNADMKTELSIRLAVEEVFVNISSYAYAPGEGDAQVECALLTDPKRLLIRFRDSGVPFDPTAHEDADTSEEAIWIFPGRDWIRWKSSKQTLFLLTKQTI